MCCFCFFCGFVIIKKGTSGRSVPEQYCGRSKVSDSQFERLSPDLSTVYLCGESFERRKYTWYCRKHFYFHSFKFFFFHSQIGKKKITRPSFIGVVCSCNGCVFCVFISSWRERECVCVQFFYFPPAKPRKKKASYNIQKECSVQLFTSEVIRSWSRSSNLNQEAPDSLEGSDPKFFFF